MALIQVWGFGGLGKDPTLDLAIGNHEVRICSGSSSRA